MIAFLDQTGTNFEIKYVAFSKTTCHGNFDLQKTEKYK